MTDAGARIELSGETVRVLEGTRIPSVCLKCGVREGLDRRNVELAVGKAKTGIGLVMIPIAILIGLGLAVSDRFGIPLWARAASGVLVLVGATAWSVASSRGPHARLEIPLCGACDAGWSRAASFQKVETWLASLVGFGAVIGLIIDTSRSIYWLAAGLGVFIVRGAFGTSKVKPLTVSRYEDGWIDLEGVDPDARARIAGTLHRTKKRKTKKRTEVVRISRPNV